MTLLTPENGLLVAQILLGLGIGASCWWVLEGAARGIAVLSRCLWSALGEPGCAPDEGE